MSVTVRWSTMARICFLALSLAFAGCADRDRVTQTTSNHPPVITTLSIQPDSVCPSTAAALQCLATDSDQDSLTYAWSLDGGSITGEAPAFTWMAPVDAGLHWLRVTVSDGRGHEVRDSLRATVLGGSLLIRTRQGAVVSRLNGTHSLMPDLSGEIEVLGTRIFTGGRRQIQERDSTGQVVRNISVSDSASGYLTVLPDGGFAYCSNVTDDVDFVDPEGRYLQTVALPDPSAESLQNVDGVVSGNTLFISEDGNQHIVAVDLSTHEARNCRTIEDDQGWLGGIGCRGGDFYVTRSLRLTRSRPTGEPETVCEFTAGNAVGIAIVAGYAFVTLNFPGEVYRVELASGHSELFLSGLDYPQDIEYVPVEMQSAGAK